MLWYVLVLTSHYLCDAYKNCVSAMYSSLVDYWLTGAHVEPTIFLGCYWG